MDPQSPQEGLPRNDTPRPAEGAPVAAHVVGERPHPPVHSPPPRRSRAGVWIALVLLAIAGLGVVMVGAVAVAALANLAAAPGERRVREEFFSHDRDARRKVAIITLEGIIMDETDGFVKRQIDRARDDEQVKAIVLRIDSPGGTVSGSDYLHHHFRKLAEDRELPIVVSMGGIAASGGYYVAMAVGDTPASIYAEPFTFTGSIGVVIPRYDLSELLQNWGIQYDSIASDDLKGMGSMAKPMTEQERELFEQIVEEGFEQFKDTIRSGRPALRDAPEALAEIATGQIFTARQAVDNGLVDRVGFVESAVDRAIELAGLDPDDVKVVRYKPEPSLARLLLGADSHGHPLDLKALMDLATPRAYYLCTRLPPLHSRP